MRLVTPYGASKLEAERLCPADALLVRTSLIYGGREPSPQERAALDAADGLRAMTFFTDELRCPIAVADLAAAVSLSWPRSTPPGRCTSPAPTRSRGWSSRA